MDKKLQEFHLLAPFSVKAATTPAHDPDTVDTGDGEIITIAGYANFSGKVEEGDGIFVDLVGDVVVPAGIDLAVFKKNPQILLQHDRQTTIGRGLTVTKKKDGLYIEAEIHANAMEPEDFYRIKSGLLSYFSIGFRTQKAEWKKIGDVEAYFITKSLLLEVSVVGIPCNSESAFQIIKSFGEGEDGFFYAGELNTQKICPSNENDNQSQTEGDTMKIKLAEMLGSEETARFKELGLEAKLDEEIEVGTKAYIDALVKVEVAKAVAAFATKAEEELTIDEELVKEEGEAPAEEEEKSADADDIETKDADEAFVKAMLDELEAAKKELEGE